MPAPETKELHSEDLTPGMILRAKPPSTNRFKIVDVSPGMAGPYLRLLKLPDGPELEHDTSLDSGSATYTVEA